MPNSYKYVCQSLGQSLINSCLLCSGLHHPSMMFVLSLLFFILLITFPLNRGTPFAFSAQARKKGSLGMLVFSVALIQNLSVRTLSIKRPVNILCFIVLHI